MKHLEQSREGAIQMYINLLLLLFVGALEGVGGKGGRTGVNDGPQTTTNTGIKVEHLLGAAFIAFIAVKHFRAISTLSSLLY